MTRNLLVISNDPNSAWLQAVGDALQSLGKIQVAPEQASPAQIKAQTYDLMIVDATSISSDVAALVARLHGECPEVPIVVVTASPTWQRARQVFLMGATDYIRRSFDRRKILASCLAVLEGVSTPLSSEGDTEEDDHA